MKKRFVSFGLLLIALVFAVSVPALAGEIYTDSTGSYQYVRNGRYAKIVKYLGTIEMDVESVYTLPDKLDGYTVNEIGARAFTAYSAPSKKLVIPDTVSSIDERAFEFVTDDEGEPITKGVRLEELTLPESLIYIGDWAFYSHAVRTLTIPGSVKFMGRRCFWSGYLETLVVEEGVKRIGDEAFSWCSALKEISLPSTLTSIGKEAFKDIGFYSDGRGTLDLVIPDAVTEIEEGAFDFCCVLGTVRFGSGLEEIGDEAFAGCSDMREIDFSACKKLRRIGKKAFTVCRSLKSVAVDPVENEYGLEIDDEAFSACPALRSITVPDNTDFGIKSVGYVYSKKAKGYVLTDKLTVNCISSGSFKPSKYYTTTQTAVYSLYKNVGLKANFVVKKDDTRVLKFNDGTKFRLIVSGNTGLKWKSTNPKVARVSRNGSVATLANGTTTLTTTLNDGTTYRCKLKVLELAK